MEYRFLGNSGLKVSEVCMGAMTFGRETAKADSHKMLDIFMEAGGNFIDTANMYSTGLSEEIVGEWLEKQSREDIVLATKVRFPMGTKPNQSGLGRKHVLASVEASLARLKTDFVDLLYAHAWDDNTPLEETLETFSGLVRQGKVRYIAASNFGARHIQKASDLSRFKDYMPFIALQGKYNLLVRSPEWELLPACEENGWGFTVWGPLLGGWLSGRYQRGMKEPGAGRVKDAEKYNRFEKWSRYNNDLTWSIIDKVTETAKRLDKSPAQVSLNWLLNKRGISSVILGARMVNQIEDNLGCVDWRLNEEDMAELDTVSDIDKPYPYDFIEMAKKL